MQLKFLMDIMFKLTKSLIRPLLNLDEGGVTITSVLVAMVLLGIISVSVIQMFDNQTKAMRMMGLLEKRALILKHYSEILVSGWDNTKQNNSSLSGAIAVYNRNSSTAVIPSTGLYLGRDLYTANANGWWQVTATGATLTGVPINSVTETLISVTLKVTFDPAKHPEVKTKLAAQEQVVFFHHNVRDTNTHCNASNDNKAITQYDFISNFKKCSTWPLIRISQSTGSTALLGFDATYFTAANKYQLHTKYGGVTAQPVTCTNGYITSISVTGVITCSSSFCPITPSSCRSYVNAVANCGAISCDSGPPGDPGRDGELVGGVVVMPGDGCSRGDKGCICPSVCPPDLFEVH